METLFVWCACIYVYQSQKFLVCAYSKGVKFSTKMVVELLKDYDMSVLYHRNKANVFADVPSHITMGSVSHIEEATKDLVKDVHRLSCSGVRYKDSPNGAFMVHHNFELSLVLEVKSK